MTKNYNDLGVEFKYLIVNDMDQKYGLWVNTVGPPWTQGRRYQGLGFPLVRQGR